MGPEPSDFGLQKPLVKAGAPDLRKAIAAQNAHGPKLLSISGVAGTGAGVDDGGNPAVVVFVEQAGAAGIPKQLDGIPVKLIVSGRIEALPGNPKASINNKGGNGKSNGKANGKTVGTTIFLAPPSDLSYAETPATYTVGVPVPDNEPSVTGTVTEFSVTPQLPQGLVLDPATGVISGTPAVSAPSTDYTVTALNEAGSAATQINITVNAPAPVETCADGIRTSRFSRPVPIGVSTGHSLVTAGTIGARVKNSYGQVFALSNNHIYAAVNAATLGDDVLQPGAYDGGKPSGDAIGNLAAFETLQFCDAGGTCPFNVIDAAIASVSPAQLGRMTPCDGYGIPAAATAAPFVGMAVKKYGRTSGLTYASIAAVNVAIKVTYAAGKTAYFTRQVYITGSGFSTGGDSGALIVTAEGNNPVALLFAGGTNSTVANPIDEVLARFNVTIDGL